MDNYVVISERDLLKLTKTAGVTYPTIPAQELWHAAQVTQWERDYDRQITHPNCTDFLTTKFPNNG